MPMILYFIALAQTTGFIVGFWRGFFTFAVLFIFFVIESKRHIVKAFHKNSWPMVFSGICYGIGGVLYANSISIVGTSISLIMLCLTPILTTLFSVLFLGEHTRKSTIIVMIICFLNIFLMFREGLRASVPIVGFIFAVSVPIVLSLNFTNLRKNPEVSRIGVSMIGGITAMLVSGIATSGVIGVSRFQLLYLIILGCVIIPVGQVLITTGTKYISAPEVSLISSLECVLGVFYIWLFMGIRPQRNYWLIGAVIFFSVFIDMILKMIDSNGQSR